MESKPIANPFIRTPDCVVRMIARKSAIVISGRVASAVLGYISLFLVARYLGPSVMGYIVFALSFVALFNFAADMGFVNAHIKSISYGMDLKKCIGTFMALRAALTGVMVALVLGSVAIWKFVLHKGFYDSTSETVIYVFVGYFVVMNLSTIITNTFDARIESGKSQTAQLSELFVRVPLVGMVIFLKLDVIALAMVYIAGALALLLAAILLFRKYEISKPDRESVRAYMKLAAPFFVLMFLAAIWNNADKLMLGYFWTSSEVGLYFGVQSITSFLYMFATAVGGVLLPALAVEYARHNKKRIRNILHKAERYIAMLVIPPVVYIIVFAEPVVKILLSNAYLPAANALRIFAVYVAIAAITNPYAQLLLASDRIWKIVALTVFGFVLYITLVIILVPKWFIWFRPLALGVTGAALAWTLYTMVGANITRTYARQLSGTYANYRIIFQIIAGFALFAALFGISRVYKVTHWYDLLLTSAAAVGIYFAILFAFREFGKDDWKTLNSIFIR